MPFIPHTEDEVREMLSASLFSGGPCFGFLCCRQALVRQMPGWIIWRTRDQEGRTGFTPALQAHDPDLTWKPENG